MSTTSPSGRATATMFPDLVGTRILIVGGGGSVGRTVAKLARELGATPIVADRGEEQFERARAVAEDVETHIVDARSQASMAAVLDGVAADHVVLCTGRALFAPIAEFDVGEVMDWIGDRIEPILALAGWVARNPGRVRSFTIVSGFLLRRPEPGVAMWALMGPAIVGLAEHLALELAPTRVNVVGPGPMVDSQMFRHALGSDAAVARVIEAHEARNPARRAVRLEDTARQVLMVIGDPVATGSFRPVDAGAALTAGTSADLG